MYILTQSNASHKYRVAQLNQRCEMTGREEGMRKGLIIDLGKTVLEFVAESKGLKLQPEAAIALEGHLRGFMDQTYQRVFESRQPKAPNDLMAGIGIISDSACDIAIAKRRAYVSGSDIDEAVNRHFCSVWPFCRGKD